MSDGFRRQQAFRERFAREHSDWIDSVSLFRQTLSTLVMSRARILDLGCGRLGLHGDDTSCVAGASVIGVDPDPAALAANRVLDETVCASGEALPFADESFDLVASAWVLEHLAEPAAVFSEVRRVLRPGGSFVFLTPNAWNYNAWLIRAIPGRWHAALASRLYARGPGDTYPVHYRANSANSIDRLRRATGFRRLALTFNGDPSYVAFNEPLYRVAARLEGLLDRPRLRPMRVHILGVAER
jgi:SAM-dependent methyltransferase